jgi:hypothetical protein
LKVRSLLFPGVQDPSNQVDDISQRLRFAIHEASQCRCQSFVHAQLLSGLVYSFRLKLLFTTYLGTCDGDASHAGQLACMGSSLGVPGGLGGSFLGQANNFALQGAQLALRGVQDPSNQVYYMPVHVQGMHGAWGHGMGVATACHSHTTL